MTHAPSSTRVTSTRGQIITLMIIISSSTLILALLCCPPPGTCSYYHYGNWGDGEEARPPIGADVLVQGHLGLRHL